MFGGDDILSSFAKNTPTGAGAGNKSTSFNRFNRMEDDDDEFFGTKKPFHAKTTSALSPSNVVKRPVGKKLEEDVDDLLSLIEGDKGGRNAKKPPLPKGPNSPTRQEIGGNKFFDEFLDDDPATSMYVPMGGRDARKPSTTSTNINNKTLNSVDYGQPNSRQRPMTSDAKGQAMNSAAAADDGIGEINLTVSRRGAGAARKAAKDRPFTSPGVLEKPESQFSDDRSMQPDTPLTKKRLNYLDEDVNDGDSDYLSGMMNRDRADSRKSFATGYGNEIAGSRTDVGGRKDFLKPDYQPGQDWMTPVKQTGSDFGGGREAFSQNTIDEPRQNFGLPRSTTMNVRRDFFDTASQLMSQPTSVNNVNYNSNPQPQPQPSVGGRRQRGDTAVSRGEPDAAKAEEEMTNLLRMHSATPKGGPVRGAAPPVDSMIIANTPNRDASILIQEGTDMRGQQQQQQQQQQGYVMLDTAGKDYLKETEEHYKKRTKEAEEYYEKRFEDLKKALEDEKKKWEENYTKEIDLLKKDKEELKDSVKVQVDRERDRMREIFNLEMESKDKLHKYELEKQKHLLEEQTEGLKRQLEAQTRLNALADEVRTSSNKLISLTDRIEQDKSKDQHGKHNELSDREKRVEELELKIKGEQMTWDFEKKRLEKLRTDLETRELEVTKNLDKEKDLIRMEYQRLTELQESIKQHDIDKKKKIETDKKSSEQERGRLEHENIKLKEEYRQKYHELELKMELFETQKYEFEQNISNSESALRNKHEEIDSLKKRLTIQEAELLRRAKALEHRELLSRKEIEEVQSKLAMIEMERLSLDKEKMEMRDVVEKAREDADAMSRFRKEYELEREKNTKLKLEMDAYSRTLQQDREKLNEEKGSLSMLHKTLEGIRYNYVKEFSAAPPQPYVSNIKSAELYSTEKENNDPFGLRRIATEFNFNQNGSRSRSPNARERPLSQGRKLFSDDLQERHVLFKDLRTEPYSAVRSAGIGSAVSAKSELDNFTQKLVTSRPFNYRSFMDQINGYGKTSTLNQTYIDMEKQGLVQDRVNYGSQSVARLKGSGNSDSSFKTSPKFKSSLIVNNKYDRVEDL